MKALQTLADNLQLVLTTKSGGPIRDTEKSARAARLGASDRRVTCGAMAWPVISNKLKATESDMASYLTSLQ